MEGSHAWEVSEDWVDGKSMCSGRELQSKKLQPQTPHTAHGGRTPKCRATQYLQAGACYLCHRSGSDQLIPTSPGIFWGNWPFPSHGRIWENPSLCSLRSPQNRNGQPAKNMQKHIPCLGCRQRPHGVPRASMEPLAKHHVF